MNAPSEIPVGLLPDVFRLQVCGVTFTARAELRRNAKGFASVLVSVSTDTPLVFTPEGVDRYFISQVRDVVGDQPVWVRSWFWGRYQTMRDDMRGVGSIGWLVKQTVLMDGTIMELGGAHLDAPGLDLLGVICGSEGQLGVVTEATLRILPKPEGARPVLIGFDSAEVAGTCVSDIIKAGVLPVAIEFMDRPCIIACEAFAHAGYPICEALLIVEVEGSPAEIDAQLALICAIARRHNPVELREARDADEAARIWLGRKSAFGAMGQINDYMCLDGTIPVTALPLVLRRISEMSKAAGLEVANVFHAGDGNMHPLILYDANLPGDLQRCEALGADILRLCVEVGGCLTGEHGVGIEKRDLMGVQFTEADLEAQMWVKDVFDPGWLLNPAKVFPLAVSAARRG